MKKNIIKTLNLSITLLMHFSCNTWQNHPGMSDNVSESKKRSVFICEYEANPNPIKINDTLFFSIKKAWLEKKWMYPRNRNETNIIEGYQLVIETANNIPKGFDETWTIGVNYKRYIRRCGETCLMTDFEKLPISNKEIWIVQGGTSLKPDVKKIILGEFTLYKRLTN